MPITLTETALATNNILITYSGLSTLLNTNALVPGANYLITDRADNGIVIQAIDTNRLSIKANAIFYVPDFQNTLALNILGVWDSLLVTPINSASIFNGLVYKNITGINTASNPSVDTTNWVVQLKTIIGFPYYVKEIDEIHYNFVLDSILKRTDKRNNTVYNFTSNFQWGNNNVNNNFVINKSSSNIINQKGILSFNIIFGGGILSLNNTFIGQLTDTEIGVNCSLTITGTSVISKCSFLADMSVLINNLNFNNKRLSTGFSDFDKTIDMSLPANFSSNILDLNAITTSNYVGIFKLINTTALNISKIINTPIHNFKFYCNSTFTANFVHTIIGSSVSDNLVSDAGLTNLMIGRADGSDFIEYKRDGNLNVRQNIVQLM